MGVVIGVLQEGGAPCVELPNSPSVTVGKPQVHTSGPFSSPGRWGNYADIASVRDITVKRKFVLRKTDITAVANWLFTLNETSVEYNTGGESKKTISGIFRLNGDLVFTSTSPSFCEVEAEFIGQVLDCNFLLPSSVEFVKVSSTQYVVKVDGTVVQTITSTTDGDGSGLAIEAGELLYWDELPEEVRGVSEKSSIPLPVSGEDVEDNGYQHSVWAQFGYTSSYYYNFTDKTIFMLAYRELIWRINGEATTIGYIPCLPQGRRRVISLEPIYYGVTKEEYAAAGNQMPLITIPPDLEDGTNPRLSGNPLSTVMYLTKPGTGGRSYFAYPAPTAIPAANGKIDPIMCGMADYEGEGYRPSVAWKVAWVPPYYAPYYDPAPPGVTYWYYGLVGYVYVFRDVTAATYPASDSLVTIIWKQTEAAVKLLAYGYGQVEQTMLDYTR